MKRLWGMVQELQAEAAAEAGARYLPVPGEALDSNGYLLGRYRGADLFHANHAFGRLMLEQIVAAVNEASAVSGSAATASTVCDSAAAT